VARPHRSRPLTIFSLPAQTWSLPSNPPTVIEETPTSGRCSTFKAVVGWMRHHRPVRLLDLQLLHGTQHHRSRLVERHQPACARARPHHLHRRATAFDAGYGALVVQQIVGATCTAVFVWTAVEWRPGRPRRGTGVRPLLKFGAGVSVANIFYYFSGNADNILVGRFLGTGPLGLYSRAYNLFLVPLRQIHGPLGNVVQPVMSAVHGEPDRYRQVYRRTLSGITVVGMPGVVFLAVMSRPVIEVLLGDRWVGAADTFRWLAVAGFLQIVGRTFSWLFTTSGRSRAMAIWAGVTAPLTALAFVCGLHWGISGVAAAYAICQLAFIAPGIWCAGGVLLGRAAPRDCGTSRHGRPPGAVTGRRFGVSGATSSRPICDPGSTTGKTTCASPPHAPRVTATPRGG